ncbi:kinase-like protein [Canariomyces notabilis]|uniref:Kinase-like protein n=1 Tax=Canariomyces notabilis TaxID=2074819 RepID=A0AAN6TAP3_9PEZI|nr:kinase-like protein [Canariomyces arenarius]
MRGRLDQEGDGGGGSTTSLVPIDHENESNLEGPGAIPPSSTSQMIHQPVAPGLPQSSNLSAIPQNPPAAHDRPEETKSRIDTTNLLSPVLQLNGQEVGPRSPSRPRTPSAVEVEDPEGNKVFIFQDNDLTNARASATARDTPKSLYSQPKSGSEHSFASIQTVNDLGFSRQETAKTTAIWSPESLHPNRVHATSGIASPDQPGDESGGIPVAAQTKLSALPRLNKLLRWFCCPKPKDPAQTRLNKLLRGFYCKPGDSARLKFIPISDIERCLSEENVQDVLRQEIPRANLDELTKRICGVPSRRRLFAILVLGNKTSCIKCLIDSDIDDSDLPFVIVSQASSSESVYTRTGKRIKCFDDWDDSEIEWLLGQQHAVACPFFDLGSGDLFFYDLPNDAVLPFVEAELAGEGGEAKVQKVLIHPAHHNFPGQAGVEKQYFAVRTLKTENKREYEAEVEILRRFSGQNKSHPHLVRLLLTYQHGKSFHMVFPWANGNLCDFWKTNNPPERGHALACWMLSQCHGIADGIREIHGEIPDSGLGPDDNLKNTGRHGDIKPENILWFKGHNGSEDHLRITDFGFSVFHRYVSRSRDQVPRGGSPSYRAPECDLPRATISVKFDIWTLGCLFLDFITWYLLGLEADEIFTDARVKEDKTVPVHSYMYPWLAEDKFFILSVSGDNSSVVATLKTSVLEWMDKLRALDHCPRFAHDFIRIIHQGLLHPDKAARWDGRKTVDELAKILDKCRNSEEYCVEPYKSRDGPLEAFTFIVCGSTSQREAKTTNLTTHF